MPRLTQDPRQQVLNRYQAIVDSNGPERRDALECIVEHPTAPRARRHKALLQSGRHPSSGSWTDLLGQELASRH